MPAPDLPAPDLPAPDLPEASDEPTLPAGDFSSWLAGIRTAIEGQGDARVPCQGCTACCRSSQFVHIGPDETETLARIPVGLLVSAPRLPAGHMVLGYDERGHCPMLVDDRCSIYEHRPRTCRTYDCRIFAATGVEVGPHQEQIARRVRQWRFAFPQPGDRTEYEAVRAAAVFVSRHRSELTGSAAGAPTATPTVLAATAVTASRAFIDDKRPAGAFRLADPDPDVDPDPEQLRLLRLAGPRRASGSGAADSGGAEPPG